eukprot:jgi/Chlat1/3743/Chrsp259S03888
MAEGVGGGIGGGVAGGTAVTAGNFTVNVRSADAPDLTIACAPKATAADVKASIHQLVGLPPAQQRLIWSGQRLPEHLPLTSLGITNGHILHLVARPNGVPPPPLPTTGADSVRTSSDTEAQEEALRELTARMQAAAAVAEASQDALMVPDREGTNTDMLLGIVMGFLLGIIMMLWLIERGVPQRLKVGILVGVGCNLSFAMLRLLVSPHTE